MSCSKCGMAYVKGDAEEEDQHANYCDMIVNGPLINLISEPLVIWKDNTHWIVRITDDSPEDQRKLAHDIGRVANQEMHYTGGIYHYNDPPDERAIQLYVYVVNGRASGILLFEKRTTVWRCTWPPLGEARPSCIEQPEISWMWSIGFIWLHSKLRHSGAGQRFFEKSLARVGKSIEHIGWHTPFSQNGATFVRRLCPSAFYVAK
jgi:hypothetical protein